MIALDRTRPPVTPELPPFKLPQVSESRLANGLTVLTIEDRRFPLVTLRLGFDAGSKYEPAELAGLADSVAALLTEGTGKRSAREIAEEATALGGVVRADASADSLIIAANALSENLDPLLALVADVARAAAFPDDEVDLRKQHRAQELLAQLSDAAFLADEMTNHVVFAPHPYARQEPTFESIERWNRSALASFRDAHLTPANALLVLLGDLPAGTAELIERHFGGWQARPVPAAPAAQFPAPRRTIVLVDRPGSVQADIRIARLAVTRTDPDYFPLAVANTILGGGASSRLFMNVREAKGYAYDARSSALPYRDAGVFEAVTQVRNEVLREAIETVIEEMRRIGTEPVEPQELQTVKNYMCGTFVLRLETQESVAAQIAGTRLMGLPVEYLERYTERVRAVEPDQLRAAAAKYMHPDDCAIVVVGDAQALKSQLEAFGRVTIEKAEA